MNIEFRISLRFINAALITSTSLDRQNVSPIIIEMTGDKKIMAFVLSGRTPIKMLHLLDNRTPGTVNKILLVPEKFLMEL